MSQKWDRYTKRPVLSRDPLTKIQMLKSFVNESANEQMPTQERGGPTLVFVDQNPEETGLQPGDT